MVKSLENSQVIGCCPVCEYPQDGTPICPNCETSLRPLLLVRNLQAKSSSHAVASRLASPVITLSVCLALMLGAVCVAFWSRAELKTLNARTATLNQSLQNSQLALANAYEKTRTAQANLAEQSLSAHNEKRILLGRIRRLRRLNSQLRILIRQNGEERPGSAKYLTQTH